MAEHGSGSGNVEEGIDHIESQRILKEEQRKVGRQDLSVYFQNAQQDDNLEGPPLSMKDCKRWCSSGYVKDVLFRKSGRAKENTPLKLSDLQHTGLAKVILQKFIETERCLPNNNQVAIYFIQKLYCEQILRKQVDWEERPTNAGVGRGRPGERAAAKRENIVVDRLKPVVLTQQVHMTMAEIAAKRDADLEAATQRIAALEAELQAARDENSYLLAKCTAYELQHGPIDPNPEFDQMDLDDLLRPNRP